MINVLLVDDHVLIRKGIALLLENHVDIAVVGEANDGEEADSISLPNRSRCHIDGYFDSKWAGWFYSDEGN